MNAGFSSVDQHLLKAYCYRRISLKKTFGIIKMEEIVTINETDKKYYCYWIISGNSSYIGATVDPCKRLKQHCGLYSGGARRTQGKIWNYKLVISGFRTWKEALQFEWSFKYHSKRCRSVQSRKDALETLLNRERWTSNSPLATEVPLHLEWDPKSYGTGTFSNNVYVEKARRASIKKRSNFKKNLHGVRY